MDRPEVLQLSGVLEDLVLDGFHPLVSANIIDYALFTMTMIYHDDEASNQIYPKFNRDCWLLIQPLAWLLTSLQAKIKPNIITYSTMLKGHCQTGELGVEMPGLRGTDGPEGLTMTGPL